MSSNPPETTIARAINRVLAAEREAEDAIAAAQREAEAVIEAARAERRRLLERARTRAARIMVPLHAVLDGMRRVAARDFASPVPVTDRDSSARWRNRSTR